MPNRSGPGFHQNVDLSHARGGPGADTSGMVAGVSPTRMLPTPPKYRFSAHFHPYATALIRRLQEGSLAGLQDADTELKSGHDEGAATPTPEASYSFYVDFFKTSYSPDSLVDLSDDARPVKSLDFSETGAYALYNWELFFHVPLAIAIHLSKNQRFEEAQRWFHYVFDPTDNSAGPTPARFWKFRPFRTTDVERIEQILRTLATGREGASLEDIEACIEAWQEAPFQPHVVARLRPPAYMLKTVMAYLDNLIAWGDTLFRQDTGESINEATQLYVLAANILGPRPQAIPKGGSVRARSYEELRASLDPLSNACIQIESDITADRMRLPTDETDDTARKQVLDSLGCSLYFCVPPNDKLLSYWDTVADRLFKIRNSLSIRGIFRQLPLFEPPIDPALLARAAAAGVEVGEVVAGLGQPLPLVRFPFLVQKATEICQEVKALGNGLLAAIERHDNEALSLIRARHERMILDLSSKVRFAQWQEAISARAALRASFDSALERYRYFATLLAIQAAPSGSGSDATSASVPDELDMEALASLKEPAPEANVQPPSIAVDVAMAGDAPNSGPGRITRLEAKELDQLDTAQAYQDAAAAAESIGTLLGVIPEFSVDLKPIGVGAGSEFGGRELAWIASMIAAVSRSVASRLGHEAGKTARLNSYSWRRQDWLLQAGTLAGELRQINKQLMAAQIREALAQWEYENHGRQVEFADEMERFLKGEAIDVDGTTHTKAATRAFHEWMRREAKGIHAQCYRFAFDVARKAERALQHELCDTSLTFIQSADLSGHEGLLAGEKLYLDIKRMEMAYHNLNRRDYELTTHVSLLQVAPLALLQLRATGTCGFTLPEALFDLECPGHYFRRIRSVALTIPCVTGPYTSINCTVSLKASAIRKKADVDGSYARRNDDDPRFELYGASVQTIVTSGAQNDAGLFEPMLRDERYVPFEGAGLVDSVWQLQLPANPSENDPSTFDYDTITDVVLHIRYTARDGGEGLRGEAKTNLTEQMKAGNFPGMVRLFSVRHEFPNSWAEFKAARGEGEVPRPLAISLREEHFPFWSKGRIEELTEIQLFASGRVPDLHVGGTPLSSWPDESGSLMYGKVDLARVVAVVQPPSWQFTLDFSTNAIDDLWLAVSWKGKSTS